MTNSTSRVQAQSTKKARKHSPKPPVDDARERYAAALHGGFLAIEIARRIEPSGSGPIFDKAVELISAELVEISTALESALQRQLARR